LLPAPFQSRVTCEFRVRLHNSHRVPDLIISNVRSRLAELLTRLVVKLREIDGRYRPLLHTSFYLIEVLLHSWVRDEVEGEDSCIENEVVFQLRASFLCSRSSSRMPSLMSFSWALNAPLNSLRDFTGTRRTPSSDSTNSTLDPSRMPYFSRILAGMETMLLLVTVAT